MKFNTIRSVNSQVAQMQRFLAATRSSSLWITHLPSLLPLFYFSTAKSVWQVPSSIGMGAHSWEVPIYQPWGGGGNSI